jgi:hypothetical protein
MPFVIASSLPDDGLGKLALEVEFGSGATNYDANALQHRWSRIFLLRMKGFTGGGEGVACFLWQAAG